MTYLSRCFILRLLILVLISGFAYGVYLALLSYAGYCHAVGKYLTDDEKIRVALVDLLKKYPPSVILRKHHPDATVLGYLPPENPIYYRDVDEFLALNPDCCKVNPTEKFMEGGTLTLVEKLTGTATSVIEANYLVRYRREDGKEGSIKTTGYLHITSCGTRGKPWSP